MDEVTRAAFVAHVRSLEERAIAGDLDAAKSLACMALLTQGHDFPDGPDGGQIIDFLPYLKLAA